jgi:protein-disulfide isomerase
MRYESSTRPRLHASLASLRGLLWVLCFVFACGGAATTPAASAPTTAEVAAAEGAGAPQQVARAYFDGVASDGEPGPVPVSAADPAWGNPNAPVTLITFVDFQCPYCKRAAGTVAELQQLYGPNTLRVVWKQHPLPFHANARPSAELALAAFTLGGSEAFVRVHDALFAADELDAEGRANAVKRAGFRLNELEAAAERARVGEKIDTDTELATRLGAMGTPAFFINGVNVRGAQPLATFREVIDAELEAAKAALASGVPPSRVYATRSAANLAGSEGATEEDEEAAPDTSVYYVPIAGSPARGSASALVTLVIFSDFQCPFCSRVEPTIDALRTKYGDDLRVVWKNAPLPFHDRAEPAAALALEARAQKGDAGFWAAHARLFADQSKLDDASLEASARALGLDVPRWIRASAEKKHLAAIDRDVELGDTVGVDGTPTMFINGRKLVGAQPLEAFEALIKLELAVTRELVAKGAPRAGIYEARIQDGKRAEPPKKLVVPAPTKNNPTRGPNNAPVTVHVFSDFQCSFCKRVEVTLGELDAAFPGKLRFVWHNMPLSKLHPEARGAAAASLEAFRQKGPKGFWALHERLFATDQRAADLDLRALRAQAVALGLDAARFDVALARGEHDALIDEDVRLAETLGVDGTPALVIGGYLVSGAQPLRVLRRAVNRALAP